MLFDRSRGFAMEAVDGSDIHDIVFVNGRMRNMSSSPIFIRTGNRGRFPVTGNSTGDPVRPTHNVRRTQTNWILPRDAAWTEYPVKNRYPAYTTRENAVLPDGKQVPLPVLDAVDGNAVGFERPAGAWNLCMVNITAEDVDPRYPILLAGLMDSPIRNVILEQLHMTWRGGLHLRDAVEQRQIDTDWSYTQHGTAPALQSPPWLVNTFFAKQAALLPRVSRKNGAWQEDPCNVPEMPEVYPEPSNFGILPAWGMYARHVDGLQVKDVTFCLEQADTRWPLVLDDCHNASFEGWQPEDAPAVLVEQRCKRPTGYEYVPDTPWMATACSNIRGLAQTVTVRVDAPEPGTPADSLYTEPTVADAASGYRYAPAEWTINGRRYPLPVTVYRPFFAPVEEQTMRVGETLRLPLTLRNPAAETKGVPDAMAALQSVCIRGEALPDGATLETEPLTLCWTPRQTGTFRAVVTADDGVRPVECVITLHAEA